MPLKKLKKQGLSINVRQAAEVFEQYGAFIRTVIRYNIKNEDIAEDLFQALFLSLVANPIPADVQNIKGFLYRAITNDIKDMMNKISRYKKLVKRYSEIHHNVQYQKKPEDHLIQGEETEKMFKLATRHLSTVEADVVTLRYKDSCDTTEVSQKLNVSPRTVSRYLSVSLGKIRKSMVTFKDNDYDRS